MNLADAAFEDSGRDGEVLDETLDAEDLAALLGSLVDRLRDDCFAQLRPPRPRTRPAAPCGPRAPRRNGMRSDAPSRRSVAAAAPPHGSGAVLATGSTAGGRGSLGVG